MSTMVAFTAGRDDVAFAVLSTVLSCMQMLGCASSLFHLTCRYRVVANDPVRATLPHQPVAVIAATVLPLVGLNAEFFDNEVLEMCVHG